MTKHTWVGTIAAGLTIVMIVVFDLPKKIGEMGWLGTQDAVAEQALAGVIRDGGGKPLAGVKIVLPEFGQTDTTDVHGRFSLRVRGQKEQQVRLVSSKLLFETRYEDPTLGNTSLSFVMRRTP